MNMPKFAVLMNFTDKRIKNIKDFPSGLQKSLEIMETHGVKVEALVYTLGRYDAVGIGDAPDAETVSKAMLHMASLGEIKTETLRAFTPEEMIEMVKSLP
jgi:uncharacterized protein with GYD domain